MSHENILADVGAKLFRGIEAVGGRMKITDSRILFEPNAFNLQKQPADIPLAQVAEVRKRNTMFIVPNGILVRLRSGVEYKFVVWGRDRLIRLIRDHMQP